MYDLAAAASGLELLFSPSVLGFLLLGFTLGFVVGAIPGFNDANLMAIMLPFTLYLDSSTAIIAMAALYAAAQAAGSIPAILLNIPGTPGNSASVLEGYPLSKQGRSGYALGVSFGASAVGALIGGLLSLALAPILGNFALRFGPAEMFLVGVFGLTVVSSLTGDSLAKGLLITAFGALVGLIGADAMTAFPRGTFGVYELYDGLPLIPVLLGLFGMSELLYLMHQKAVSSNDSTSQNFAQVWQGVRDALSYRLVLLMSSVVGTIIGIIPGAGATIGSFVAYGQARQMSREKEKFGTGHAEGLVASDSANNAVAAGAVVPLLTLGLPGSASATVMLAALYLHGITPGPQLFTNYAAESYAILMSLTITAFLIAILGIPLIRVFRKVTFVPTAYLVPVVGVLLFVGAYAWRFNPIDIVIMIAFGAFGAVLKYFRYPIAPFLLAIILSEIIESNFHRAYRINGFDAFYQSNISLFLIAITVASLAFPLLKKIRLGKLGSTS